MVFGVASLLVSSLVIFWTDPRPKSTEACIGHRPRMLSSLQRVVISTPSVLGEVVGRTQEATATPQARLLLAAATLRFCAGFAIMVWLPSAMKSLFPHDLDRFAVLNSAIKAIAGGVSSLAGGVTADLLKARGLGDQAGALFCFVSSVAAAPLFYLVLQRGLSFEASMVFLLLEY